MKDLAFEIRAALDIGGSGHAGYNLQGALYDIKRFTSKGEPTDDICIRTIERVIGQLAAVERILEGGGVKKE